MKKLLWHNKNERPKFNDTVGIVFYTDYDAIRVADFLEEWDWKIFCIERHIEKWCYFSELKQDNVFMDVKMNREIDIESLDNITDALIASLNEYRVDGHWCLDVEQRDELLNEIYDRLTFAHKLLNQK